jgi:hypothetical protein
MFSAISNPTGMPPPFPCQYARILQRLTSIAIGVFGKTRIAVNIDLNNEPF